MQARRDFDLPLVVPPWWGKLPTPCEWGTWSEHDREGVKLAIKTSRVAADCMATLLLASPRPVLYTLVLMAGMRGKMIRTLAHPEAMKVHNDALISLSEAAPVVMISRVWAATRVSKGKTDLKPGPVLVWRLCAVANGRPQNFSVHKPITQTGSPGKPEVEITVGEADLVCYRNWLGGEDGPLSVGHFTFTHACPIMICNGMGQELDRIDEVGLWDQFQAEDTCPECGTLMVCGQDGKLRCLNCGHVA